MAKRAKAPQDRRSQPARQRAVAVGKRGKARMSGFAGEKFVERDAAPQHAVEDIGGDSSGGKAGDFRLGRGARTRHTPIVAAKLCRGRELWPKISTAHRLGRPALP